MAGWRRKEGRSICWKVDEPRPSAGDFLGEYDDGESVFIRDLSKAGLLAGF